MFYDNIKILKEGIQCVSGYVKRTLVKNKEISIQKDVCPARLKINFHHNFSFQKSSVAGKLKKKTLFFCTVTCFLCGKYHKKLLKNIWFRIYTQASIQTMIFNLFPRYVVAFE